MNLHADLHRIKFRLKNNVRCLENTIRFLKAMLFGQIIMHNSIILQNHSTSPRMNLISSDLLDCVIQSLIIRQTSDDCFVGEVNWS